MVTNFGLIIISNSLARIIAAAAVVVTAPAWAQQGQGPAPVTVAAPLVEEIVDWDEYTGRFEAVSRVALRARVSGYLERILFKDGTIVEKGDPLFVIDQRPFQTQLARAVAELQSATAEQTRAETELERGRRLVENNTVAESTLDERVAAKLRADAQVAVAEAAVSAAQLDLEYTQVSAPFTGRISDAKVDVGNLVAGGETLLATIVSEDPIHLVFTASEADFLNYSRLSLSGDRESSRTKNNRVQARLLDETGWPHEGRMDFVANEIDENAGTITGRAVFENPDSLLTPGLFARLRLIGSGEYEALLLPDAAVLSDQARKIVMVVDDAGLVSAKPVTLGPLYRGMRVIRDGLSAQDRVIVNGVQRAQPGGQVAPEETTLSLAPDSG